MRWITVPTAGLGGLLDVLRLSGGPQRLTLNTRRMIPSSTLGSSPNSGKRWRGCRKSPRKGGELGGTILDNGYFENNVVGAIREWFSETPYWGLGRGRLLAMGGYRSGHSHRITLRIWISNCL